MPPRLSVEQPQHVGLEGHRLDRIEHAKLGQESRRVWPELDACAGLVGEHRALEQRGAHAVPRKRNRRA